MKIFYHGAFLQQVLCGSVSDVDFEWFECLNGLTTRPIC